jgi:hypothetical protein
MLIFIDIMIGLLISAPHNSAVGGGPVCYYSFHNRTTNLNNLRVAETEADTKRVKKG